MPRPLLAAATAVLVLGACLPRAETVLLSEPPPAVPLTQTQPPEGDVSLPAMPTRPETTTRDAASLVPGAEGRQVAVLSVGPAQGPDGSFRYAELGLGCRAGAAVMALAMPGTELLGGGRWFSGGAEGRLGTAADGRVTGPASALSGLSGRRVEIQADAGGGHVVAAEFELSEIRAALAGLPCG